MEEVMKYFCHLGQYKVPSPEWPVGRTILLLKYEMQTEEGEEESEDEADDDDNADASGVDDSLAKEIDKIEIEEKYFTLSPPTTSNWEIFENGGCDNHAEKVMLDELYSRMKPCDKNSSCDKIVLDIVLSYSPCNQEPNLCAEGLVDFKKYLETKTKAEVEMTVKVANFYNKDKEENKRGLCLLLKNNINLDVFKGADDWESFLRKIGTLDERNEFTIMRKDSPFKQKRTTREDKDISILEDLKRSAEA